MRIDSPVAAKDGRVTPTSPNSIAQQLTPDQIAEAERSVAEWQPNPAECETTAAQAGN